MSDSNIGLRRGRRGGAGKTVGDSGGQRRRDAEETVEPASVGLWLGTSKGG